MVENTFLLIEKIPEILQKYPFSFSFALGLIPALIWLWFWLKEDEHPEPAKMITLSFLGGMLAVICVLPLQKFVYDLVSYNTFAFFLWASLEEIFKFAIIYFIALRNRATDEPVDTIIYMIVGALGFVALENTLFLVDLMSRGDVSGVLMTINLRFIGASLLHIISSATIGIFMAISFYKKQSSKIIYTSVGLILAILLHTSFNLIIISKAESSVLLAFGMVWICIIILLILFEKIKHIIPNYRKYER
ncbi:MAG: PrsW family glutamic-type intramembrane protease [Candidatus Paceibacterota bacterium]